MTAPIYKRLVSTQQVATEIASLINQRLISGQKVLWLVPGGSASIVAAQVSKQIKPSKDHLFISLTDERPGRLGHEDSNWETLLGAGFNPRIGSCFQILSGKTTETETRLFDSWLHKVLDAADFRLGLLGVGSDGHTAGILPGSDAQNITAAASYYRQADKSRISITPVTLSKLDVIFVYAVGVDKREVLDKLSMPINPVTMPAQYLKTSKSLIIYNDFRE